MEIYIKSDLHPRNFSIKLEYYIPLDEMQAKIESSGVKNVSFLKDKNRITIINKAKQLVERNNVKLFDRYFAFESFNKNTIYKTRIFPLCLYSCGQRDRCLHIIACEMKIRMFNKKNQT